MFCLFFIIFFLASSCLYYLLLLFQVHNQNGGELRDPEGDRRESEGSFNFHSLVHTMKHEVVYFEVLAHLTLIVSPDGNRGEKWSNHTSCCPSRLRSSRCWLTSHRVVSVSFALHCSALIFTT